MAFFMFLSFFIIFDVFACAFVSGCSQSIFESNAPFLVYISLLFYLEAPITFLTFSIITIYLLIDKKRPKIHSINDIYSRIFWIYSGYLICNLHYWIIFLQYIIPAQYFIFCCDIHNIFLTFHIVLFI